MSGSPSSLWVILSSCTRSWNCSTRPQKQQQEQEAQVVGHGTWARPIMSQSNGRQCTMWWLLLGSLHAV